MCHDAAVKMEIPSHLSLSGDEKVMGSENDY